MKYNQIIIISVSL